MAQGFSIDPEKGLDTLVRQLADDSRRLYGDEVRLAKLETAESMYRGGRGALWLGLAFGVAIVALVAFTLFFASFFGRMANGHYWVGALLTAAVETAVGLWLLQKGMAAYKAAPYSLPDTRAGLTVLKKL